MTFVRLDQVSVDFPVYGAGEYSIRQRIASTLTRGRVGRDTGVTVIRALKSITLELKSGDRLGLMGHNGAGKSTLLRTLAGIYSPSSGTIERRGTIASLIDPAIGIEPEATGYENIMLRGLVMGLSRREVERLTPEIGSFSGLGDYLKMPVRTYSTGMAMRLAFSISTSVRADILLMDEWLSVGDADFNAKAEQRMKEMVAGSGILVLASHSPELIARECNRIVLLDHGAIVEDRRCETRAAVGVATG